MGIKGVAAWIGGIAGGLALAGVAGFYLMPRACGCSEPYDLEDLVGMTGSEIVAEVQWCQSVPPDVPREQLTWWTLVSEPDIVADAGVEPLPTRVTVTPYQSPSAEPETFDVIASRGHIWTPMPEGRSQTHIAVTDEGTVPMALVETEWGAAFFIDGCMDKALRSPDGREALSDAEVAAWPTLSVAEVTAIYGELPQEPATASGR